jgi:hypothetical protein
MNDKVEAPCDKMPWYLLKTDTGEYSLSASLVLWSFFATLLMLIAEFVLVALKIPHPDAEGLIATVLLPTVANYFGRKWTDASNQAKIEVAASKAESEVAAAAVTSGGV